MALQVVETEKTTFRLLLRDLKKLFIYAKYRPLGNMFREYSHKGESY